MPAQRLFESVRATASATGTAQFILGTPPTDLVWQGTVVCNTAPGAAVFAAFVGGSQWCSWAGAAIGGPVQALPGEQVIVTATGLTANTSYVLTWIGRSDSYSGWDPSYPDTNAAGGSTGTTITQPPGSSVLVAFQGGASQASVVGLAPGTSALLGTPPAGQVYLLHNASFQMLASGTLVEIVGHTTGFVYATFFSNAGVGTVPLMGQVANEALDVTTVGGSGGSCWLSYDLSAVPVTTGGGNVPVVFQLSHSYAVPGVVVAQTLPPFFVPVMVGQTAILEAIRCQLQSGTSISLALQQNGSNIGGLGAVSVTTTPTTTLPSAPVNLSNNDALQAVLSLPVANPAGLTISVYVQYT